MIVKKIDKRHNGYGIFKYVINFSRDKKQLFCEIRAWCWKQWGPSCELDFYSKVDSTVKSAQWAWMFDEFRTNLYLQSDKEYQWYLLKWHIPVDDEL